MSSVITSSTRKNFVPTTAPAFAIFFLPLAENARRTGCKVEMAKAKELYAKIAAGEDFAKLAQEYSEGAGRAAGR